MAPGSQQRVVLVAGGSGDLGRALARAFLDTGARVVATARRPEGLAALEAGAGEGRERLTTRAADVARPDEATRLVADVVATFGRLDVLVDAVGGWVGGAPLWQTEPAVFERMLEQNLRSLYALTHAALPHMVQQRRGWVLGVASRAARAGQAKAAAYAAAKAGVLGLLASLALEVEGLGIRVNALVPDVIDTPSNREAMPGADFSRWSAPGDIARVAVFLCSEEARAVHGAEVPV